MFMCGVGHITEPSQKAAMIPHAFRVKPYRLKNGRKVMGFETISETPYCEKHAGAAEHNYRAMVKSVMEEVR